MWVTSRDRSLQAVPQRLGHSRHRLLVETRVAHGTGGVMRLEEPLGVEVDDRGIVLVDRGHQDVPAVGLGDLGQRVAPPIVGLPADLAPIDGDEHDG
jgi:hypothetical protein